MTDPIDPPEGFVEQQAEAIFGAIVATSPVVNGVVTLYPHETLFALQLVAFRIMAGLMNAGPDSGSSEQAEPKPPEAIAPEPKRARYFSPR